MRQEVWTIRADVEDEASVSHGQRFQERRSRWNVYVELEDAVLFVAQAELARGAEHAVGDRTADLPLLDLEAVRQHGARRRERIDFARLDVRRAANDVQQRSRSGVHLG